jgi:hypothetical protein
MFERGYTSCSKQLLAVVSAALSFALQSLVLKPVANVVKRVQELSTLHTVTAAAAIVHYAVIHSQLQ